MKYKEGQIVIIAIEYEDRFSSGVARHACKKGEKVRIGDCLSEQVDELFDYTIYTVKKEHFWYVNEHELTSIKDILKSL